ncbi:MAG TPA: hypothetical protein VL361_28305 [Candidatus Limnocylindrales bacterium]|nr:hypothetical protein [Candidatus Limnocylindrales bacterium]
MNIADRLVNRSLNTQVTDALEPNWVPSWVDSVLYSTPRRKLTADRLLQVFGYRLQVEERLV